MMEKKLPNQIHLGGGWLQISQMILYRGKVLIILGTSRTVINMGSDQVPFLGGKLLVKIG
jgi:hypothetical protein